MLYSTMNVHEGETAFLLFLISLAVAAALRCLFAFVREHSFHQSYFSSEVRQIQVIFTKRFSKPFT